jgi:PAS domain S-box-containing protein
LEHSKKYSFLRNGGEMGQLTAQYDWSSTPVGVIENWPQNLKNALSIILQSAFPMLLFWGDDFLAFYNDPYSEILKSGNRHPAIGKKAADIWPEGWDAVKPLLEKAYGGEPVYFEDLLIPVFRNGQMEDVYWTFKYSPLYGNEDTIEGIIISCAETTEKVSNYRQLQESNDELQFAIEAAELAVWDLNPQSQEFKSNRRLRDWFGLAPDEEIPLSLATEIVIEEDRQRVVDAINHALTYESGGKYDIEYTIRNPLTGVERIVRAKGRSWFNDDKIAYRFNGTLQDVTDQVTARKKIEQSEAKLSSIIASAPAGIGLFVGRDLIIEMPNQTFIDIVGKGWDVVGKPLREAMPELVTEGQPFLKILDDVFTTGKMFQSFGSMVQIVKDGVLTSNYYNITYSPLFDENNEVYAILDIAVDVTDAIIASQKLQQSEQRVRALIESAPFPIAAYYGREMRIEMANQSIMDIWGKGNDVVGKLYAEVLPEMLDQKVFEQLENVYETGIAFHAKNQHLDIIVNGESTPYYFNYSFTPLFDVSGKVYGVMNTGADVTDLNLAKQKVEQSEKNFRNMILQAPVAMCILLGPEHVIDIANDFMVELWGKERDEVMNRPVWEAIPDAREQGLEELMTHVYTHNETFSAYERPVELLRNGKKEIVYQNFVYEPYKDSSDKVLGVLVISIDVTAQVLARQKIEEIVQERTLELEQVNNNLKKSNAELAQFAYITSHDLQEPVRKISIFTNMLENTLGTLDERPTGYIKKIKNSAERMSNLIKDVLVYSQVSKEHQNFTRVDLNKVVAETLTDYELVIEQRGATVNFNGLPVVDAIPLQMSQLFGNLMSNSLKYTLPEVNPFISIRTGRLTLEEFSEYVNLDTEKEYYKIEFTDNGIGFEPEYADKIFNIFQRLHTKSEYSGTGIGLAMCKKIMENHHGDIKAEPREGGGATFKIVLPVRQ